MSLTGDSYASDPIPSSQVFPSRSHAHLLLFVTLTMTSLWAAPQEEEGSGIPAYNAGPPPKNKLPAILAKDQLWGAMRNIRTRRMPTNWQRKFR